MCLFTPFAAYFTEEDSTGVFLCQHAFVSSGVLHRGLLAYRMSGCAKPPAPQLQEANRLLHALRAHKRKQRQVSNLSMDSLCEEDHDPLCKELLNFHKREMGAADVFAGLPDHLGWGSGPLTAVLRSTRRHKPHNNRKRAAYERGESEIETAVSLPKLLSVKQPNPDDTVKLYPDIALGMLRVEQAAAGRIWLLLRYLDEVGQGWLRVAIIRKNLTTNHSPIRVCGWRQLRNLLRQGDGIFWTRDKTRIWLKSAANVAAALGVERLTGKPVTVPVRVLTGSIGQIRAHLYAGFHSGRCQEDRRQPIARETLTELTGVGRRTQIVYEALTGLSVQHNYAIAEQYSPETAEKHAWHQGQATFVFQDSHGTQGRPGRSYIAWQLPNSYGSCHPHAPEGRQRRINRKLTDLVIKGVPGNSRKRLDTRYYPDGKQAVKMASRHQEWNIYWWRQRTRNGRSDLWQQVG